MDPNGGIHRLTGDSASELANAKAELEKKVGPLTLLIDEERVAMEAVPKGQRHSLLATSRRQKRLKSQQVRERQVHERRLRAQTGSAMPKALRR